MMDLEKAERILESVRQAAIDYQELTGKPFGITGEFGECMTAKLLGLELAKARQKGYDAIDKDGHKIEIKSRRLRDENPRSATFDGIRIKDDWDCLMLILFDEKFAPKAIYGASKDKLRAVLDKPGRNPKKKGSLPIKKFISLGEKIWPTDST